MNIDYIAGLYTDFILGHLLCMAIFEILFVYVESSLNAKHNTDDIEYCTTYSRNCFYLRREDKDDKKYAANSKSKAAE